MKNLIQIIEIALFKDQEDPTTKSNNKINNIKYPTKSARSHTFRGPRLGGIKSDGSLGKVSRLRKDRTQAYINQHPTLNKQLTTASRKLISKAIAQKYLDSKVNIDKVISLQKPRTWQVSNSQMKISYVPNAGRYLPNGQKEGVFYIIN